MTSRRATEGPNRPRAGVLALTLELYETLAPTLREEREQWLRQHIIPALGKIAEVSFDRAVYRREDVEAAVARLETEGVDALVVILLTYSPSQITLPALKRTRLPIIVWNTQELWGIDSAFSAVEMTSNHGVHGTQDLCNVLLRSGIDFEYVTSHLDDEDPRTALADFRQAAAAVRRLGRARLADGVGHLRRRRQRPPALHQPDRLRRPGKDRGGYHLRHRGDSHH